ncbi:MAG: prepilin-type N-terminal cleavage/methylation domain-containing protein [Candidatus Riflebacteria bacterium]|nr:prepilin-type N-terminal cleavage/methylation domain-containing protein [Candidatus Riflebacteria bacterium]
MTKKAFSLTEVMIAITIAAFLFGALVLMTSSSAADTQKTANRLLAMQLALETLNIIQSFPPDSITTLVLNPYNGPITDSSGETIVQPGQAVTSGLEMKYADSYQKGYFYREITVEDLPEGNDTARFLKKVVVKIGWNENNNIPSSIENPHRDKSIEVATFVLNEKQYY